MSRDKRGLGNHEPHGREAPPELFLAMDGLALDDLPDRGQAACLHIYAFD